MNILRLHKRTRLFLYINIVGLAIGLASSIMLILFVVNELSYDRHFANNERIVRLNSVMDANGDKTHYGICLRKAYSELPANVPGIEASVQIYDGHSTEVIKETQHFQNFSLLYADPEFFKVFKMNFAEGTAEKALESTKSAVITRKKAEVMFGNAANAMNQAVQIEDQEFIISAVVEGLPTNTHFNFDILLNMNSIESLEYFQGLEFFTYYLIAADASLKDVRASIETEYTKIIEPFGKYLSAVASGTTEKLTDLYLHSQSKQHLGRTNSMSFIWLLSTIALLILLLAITNFINLFMAQGETRMNEIGVRKANGASKQDIASQFLKEICVIVSMAFVLGILLTTIFTPHFSTLINKDIDLVQLINPWFITSVIILFIITVTLSAIYPSVYLSKFSPLDILANRLSFSKRKLNIVVIIFQSTVTIILMSFILIVNKQTSYLENLPLGYNPTNVVSMGANKNLARSFEPLKQKLLALPDVKAVSGSQHSIGGGASGQGISLLTSRDVMLSINEYRVLPDLCELMDFKLVEGDFYKSETSDSINQIILNEAAIKMLGLEYPVVGKQVNYKGIAEIIGVVKDFYYDDPAFEIKPLILKRTSYPGLIYIKFEDNISKIKAMETARAAFSTIDPEFVMNPTWSEDTYKQKFENAKTQSKIILIGSLLSIFIAALGLLAIHLYTTIRRTKEIGIRRVNGATLQSIFTMLSFGIIQWVIIAGIVATPIAFYIATNWLDNYVNRASISWTEFVIPIVIQCIIAVAVTSAVSLKALIQNPVESLKND